MISRGVLSFALLPLCLALTAQAVISDIGIKILGGPSKSPHTRCYNHEMVEKGDVVVIQFNASYAPKSPSGVPGKFITGSHEHSKAGSPLAVPVGSPYLRDGWDLALLGLCEDDRVSLTVPPEYVQGKAFEGKNVPDNAVVQIDVHIVDILVDIGDSEEDSDEEEEYEIDSEDWDEDEDFEL